MPAFVHSSKLHTFCRPDLPANSLWRSWLQNQMTNTLCMDVVARVPGAILVLLWQGVMDRCGF